AMVALYMLKILVQPNRYQYRELSMLPPPLAGEGWGGGELAPMSLVACPLPVPPKQAGEGTQEPIACGPRQWSHGSASTLSAARSGCRRKSCIAARAALRRRRRRRIAASFCRGARAAGSSRG